MTDVFQNLRLAYTGCQYFKFEKRIFHFPFFSGVIFLMVLIGKLDRL